MLVARARGVDLTQVGSGKTGATNALRALGTGVVVIALTRFVSLGSMLGTIVAAVVLVYMVEVGGWPVAYGLFAVGAAAFILISHHDNIKRLLQGRERKLGGSG